MNRLDKSSYSPDNMKERFHNFRMFLDEYKLTSIMNEKVLSLYDRENLQPFQLFSDIVDAIMCLDFDLFVVAVKAICKANLLYTNHVIFVLANLPNPQKNPVIARVFEEYFAEDGKYSQLKIEKEKKLKADELIGKLIDYIVYFDTGIPQLN